MVLDHVVALPNGPERGGGCLLADGAVGRALSRGDGAGRRPSSALSKAGSREDLRQQCAEALVQLDFDGYAVGGLSVGEAAGRDVSHRRGDLSGLAADSAPLFDGSRPTGGFAGGDSAGASICSTA